MRIDCHVHTTSGVFPGEKIIARLDEAGMDKMILFSQHPVSFNPPGNGKTEIWSKATGPEDALKGLMDWASCSARIIPFFWIDPLEDDALLQVDRAVEAGVAGFKVICNRFFPCDEKPMRVWEHIAKAGKPVLFHSGILYSAGPSSIYNRPAGFEGLFEIPGFRFAMAHVSWPWCDEMLAVYGHWSYLKRNGLTTSELFIDTTPGTPRIYRKEVFFKIFSIGYDVEDNVIFGTDCTTDYDSAYAKSILEMDGEALDNAGVSPARREKYYGKNVLRFLG